METLFATVFAPLLSISTSPTGTHSPAPSELFTLVNRSNSTSVLNQKSISHITPSAEFPVDSGVAVKPMSIGITSVIVFSSLTVMSLYTEMGLVVSMLSPSSERA